MCTDDTNDIYGLTYQLFSIMNFAKKMLLKYIVIQKKTMNLFEKIRWWYYHVEKKKLNQLI